MKIDLDSGKYTYVYDEDTGRQYALRYGEEWQDLTGDNFIHALACVATGAVSIPENLHPSSAHLVIDFASAMAEKLMRAEAKYGFTDNWANPAWMDKCRDDLAEHIKKGDPLDVAAYCAFLWYHNEPTNK